MDLKLETMDMSLDEYIEMSKRSNSNSFATANSNSNYRSSGGNDAKFGRRRGGNSDDEEDEDEDVLLKSDDDEIKEETDTGIWKGPDASISYIDCLDRKNDLREKLNSSSITTNNNNNRNAVSSVQYRLMAPNNSADRPRGIPTLLPLDAYVHRSNGSSYNNNRQRRRNYGRNRRNNNFNNSFGSNFNNNNSYGNNNNNNMAFNAFNDVNKFRHGGINSGRIQRNRFPDLSKNVRVALNGNESINRPGPEQQLDKKKILVELSSDAINLSPAVSLKPSFQVPHSILNVDQQGNRSMQIDGVTSPQQVGNRVLPVGNLTTQAQAALDLNTNSNPPANSSNDNLKSLLGFQGNISGEMMPVFASRLLEFLQNGAQAKVHKPVYDMKIQKDIHEIQNKPLLYKCNGGEVVSSDGAGVNCEIIPRTSGVSLNCRFS